MDKTIYAQVAAGWFDDRGPYTIRVTEVSDSFEPDDTVVAARPIAVGGVAQQHSLFPDGEEDWVSFAVTSGWKYAMQTGPGPPSKTSTTFSTCTTRTGPP